MGAQSKRTEGQAMARAGAFGIVLVAMALAMVASTEVEEVAEMGAAGMSRGPPMLKKMDVQSLKIIDDQMKQSKVLQKEEFVLRTKLNSPPEACAHPPGPTAEAIA